MDRRSFITKEMSNIPICAGVEREEFVKNDLIEVFFKGISFQEMEENLRKQDSNIYLVARDEKERRHFTLWNSKENKVAEYGFTVVVGDQNKALAEILKHSSSQEQNFLKLAKAGVFALRLG